MRNTKNIIKKLLLIITFILVIFTISGCKKEPEEVTIEMDLSAETISVGEEVTITVTVSGATDESYTLSFSEEDVIRVDAANVITVQPGIKEEKNIIIFATANADKTVIARKTLLVKADLVIEPDPDPEIKIGIDGKSELKSGQKMKLDAVVTGTKEDGVIWEIKSGQEFVTIDENGYLTANEISSDKVIEVIARSKANNEVFAAKTITLLGKPTLTQAMLDQLNVNKISFEGYININLYTFPPFQKLDSTHSVTVKTAMDGVNWYAEYKNAITGLTSSIYYTNHNNIASQVGLNFMNTEEYLPITEDDGSELGWEESGFYNNFIGLNVSDFKFNEETWRYHYVGSDSDLPSRMIASANPYEFNVNDEGFALLVEENEILGIYAKSFPDYRIAQGYEAIQELIVVINHDDEVEVPTISKYSSDENHADLVTAIDNMRSLDSYSLRFKETSSSVYIPGLVYSGYDQIVTNDSCYFTPFTWRLDTKGEEVFTHNPAATYGYKKINEGLYNTFVQEDGKFRAVRAYETDFKNAKPSFEFAAEIFRTYHLDEETGRKTYYVDDLMVGVATTFYYGVGNDINLYGIFAAATDLFGDATFKPYVIVEDEYIVESGFYYNMGTMFGVVQIEYSDFNNATIPAEVSLDFTVREVPSSWDQLTISATKDFTGSDRDEEINALEFLKDFFDNEDIGEIMPFFGIPLGDTYGFGLTTFRMPAGTNVLKEAILFYYDVPLDLDYTIEESISLVEEYLLDLGFERDNFGHLHKNGIGVDVTDTNLDLMIYVWIY